MWDSVDLFLGQRRPQFRPAKQVEERRPLSGVGEHHVADVQARLAGDDFDRVRRVDRRALCSIGLFSTGPEALAFSEPESSVQERLLRLLVVARGLALRATLGRGQLDVDSRAKVGLRLCWCGRLPVLTLFLP